MKQWALLACVLLLTGCGYRSMYKTTGEELSQVYIKSVVVGSENHRLPGERRVAQLTARGLKQVFTGEEGAPYSVTIDIEETRNTLAVLRDALEDRFDLVLEAQIEIKDLKGQRLFTKKVSTSSPYNVESSPYGTDAAKISARQSATTTLTGEIVHHINHFLYTR